MFNKERFHNQIAMRLGYDFLFKQGVSIAIDDKDNPDDPWVTVCDSDSKESIRFKASDREFIYNDGRDRQFNEIIDAVYYVYIESKKPF